MNEFIPDIIQSNSYFSNIKLYEGILNDARKDHYLKVISNEQLVEIEKTNIPKLKRAIIAYNDYMDNGFLTIL